MNEYLFIIVTCLIHKIQLIHETVTKGPALWAYKSPLNSKHVQSNSKIYIVKYYIIIIIINSCLSNVHFVLSYVHAVKNVFSK